MDKWDKNKIQKVKGSDNTYKVELLLTRGELYALENALEQYPSEVGKDVLGYLQRALGNAGMK